MKRVLFFVICISIALYSLAQNQQGIVKTSGRLDSNGNVIAGKRLADVTIQVKGHSPVVTDSQGRFSLPVDSGTFVIQSVKKKGYDLIDKDALNRIYHYSENPLVIVMDTFEKQNDDKLANERKIRRALQRKLQAQEDSIEALREQNKISKEEYEKRLQQIFAMQVDNEKILKDMAERYSQTDFDQMDEFNQHISELILNGQLTEADSLLQNKGDIQYRLERLEKAQNQLTQQVIDLANDIKNMGQIHEAKGDFNEALDCYTKALSLLQSVLEPQSLEIQQIEEKIKELKNKEEIP